MLQLHNTLTRKKEKFKPIEDNQVRLYTCGPTVYDFAHIGNFRAYICADILKRYLKYYGFKVKHVMNITDVDDKTIRNSQARKLPLLEYTQKYTKAFFEDLKTLNIEPADVFPKATETIPDMVKIIKKLLRKKIAYKGEDGSIYFNISKFNDYGKFANMRLDNLQTGASGRVKSDEYDKESVHDFALWKAWDKGDGDVFWETELGKGRPGWHIECSAMSMKYLGEQIDVHTGGVDLIFPHHQNEIAQSESYSGKQFVKFWVHNEYLQVEGQKMSKSLNNFLKIQDLKERGFDPLALRYLFLTAHYKSLLNFTWQSLEAAQTALNKLEQEILKLKKIKPARVDKSYKTKFIEYLNDDLNTPQALALAWDLLKSDLPNDVKLATLLDFDKVFGLKLDEVKEEKIEIPDEVLKLAQARQQAREDGDFVKADVLREKIKAIGFVVEDTEDGFKIKP